MVKYDTEKNICEVSGTSIDILQENLTLLHVSYMAALKCNGEEGAKHFKEMYMRMVHTAFMTSEELSKEAEKAEAVAKKLEDAFGSLTELLKGLKPDEKVKSEKKDLSEDEIESFNKWLYGEDDEDA